VGRKIYGYYDDTLTFNPNDELEVQYSYTADGYLTSYETFQTTYSDAYQIKFERDNNKKLVKIIRIKPGNSDTTLIKTQTSGTNTLVYEVNTDSTVRKHQRWIVYNSINQYTNILYIHTDPFSGDTVQNTSETYLYNSDGTLMQRKIVDTVFNFPLSVKNYTLAFTSY